MNDEIPSNHLPASEDTLELSLDDLDQILGFEGGRSGLSGATVNRHGFAGGVRGLQGIPQNRHGISGPVRPL